MMPDLLSHPSSLMAGALILDGLLGEPQRWHPLVGFGHWAAWVERRSYAPSRLRGVLTLVMTLAPPVGISLVLSRLAHGWGTAFSLWTLYFALGLRSLHDHVRPICQALDRQDDKAARRATAAIVSRDEATLAILPATCESVLENGNDGVFGALFWFWVGGAPGVILYRLANTLDATWGYKSTRYLHFGWAAARFDDVLNWIPARLTAFTYAFLGKFRHALVCWSQQAPQWDSPNAGPVMAAGAGSLNIRLGGWACYGGEWHERPRLGCGRSPQRNDIDRALTLVRRGAFLWVLAAVVMTWMPSLSRLSAHA
ncbi:CobD/CbiB family cobalamin biosynthesis protein [Ferrovum sp.]|uniref:CobD/CbiB family cobalamin biosynthesis protein n=1 Tax=Ferrovum sp. TaxID=2609467 RepID=UPI002603B97E|nr:CobD/CbiB family cobalamin biosynthesis protein [Ferrovum sp.]